MICQTKYYWMDKCYSETTTESEIQLFECLDEYEPDSSVLMLLSLVARSYPTNELKEKNLN